MTDEVFNRFVTRNPEFYNKNASEEEMEHNHERFLKLLFDRFLRSSMFVSRRRAFRSCLNSKAVSGGSETCLARAVWYLVRNSRCHIHPAVMLRNHKHRMRVKIFIICLFWDQ